VKPEIVQALEADPPAAVEWVRERGGKDACLRATLKVSPSTKPTDVYAALKKAGAPVGVYGLLSEALFHEGRKVKTVEVIGKGIT